MIELAALDMAGTTVQEGGTVYVVLREAVEAHTDQSLPDALLAQWKGTSKREAIAGLLDGLAVSTDDGPDEATVDKVFADFTERLVRAYRESPPTPLPGVTEALTRLRDAGVKVALQTGYSREIAEAIMEALGWSVGGTVDALVTSDEVRLSRPAPYLIFHAMEATGVERVDRVLVAGDTVNDLRAGSNASARYVVGVLTGACDAETLGRERHTHLLRSVADFPSLLG